MNQDQTKINHIAEELLKSNLCTPKLNKILGLIIGIYPGESCARDKNGDVYFINSYGKFICGHIHDFVTESVGMARHLNLDPEKYKLLGLAIEKMPLTTAEEKPRIKY